MLSYEICKSLKDAGFQQKGNGYHLPGVQKFIEKTQNMETLVETVYVPTLSELIEACGEKFWKLEKGNNGWSVISKYTEEHIANCSTPEEAVANLYLAINAKQGNQ